MLMVIEINKLKSDKGHILQVLKDGSEKAEIIASEKVIPINMVTAPFPGFQTDLQAQWMV